MNEQTKKRIEKLAEVIYNRHGNISNVSNLLSIAKKESDIFGIGLAWKTTKSYLPIIEKELNKIDMRNKILTKQQDIVSEPVIEQEKETEKEIDFVIYYYKDGTFDMFNKEEEVIEEPAPEPEWTGLFNYRNDGTITIRRGTYSGCDITSKASIMDKFKSIRFYDMWCRGRLDEANSGKITIMPDTPRDIETLEKVISRLDALKSDKFI